MADEREGEPGAISRAPDRTAIDAAVLRLRELERRSGLDRMIAIGGYILDQFFAGSADVWRERRRNKNNSVRRIAQHPDCPLRHSSLNQALGVCVVARALPCVQTFEHVGACHVIAVLHLHAEAQEAWLRRAELERWSVRDLKAAVLESRRQEGERRGRPRATAGRAHIGRVRRCVHSLEAALSALHEVPMSVDERAELSRLLDVLADLNAARELLVTETERPPIQKSARSNQPLLRVVGS